MFCSFLELLVDLEVPELVEAFSFVFLRNQEGSQIAEEGKEKQYDANGEQGVVMAASERRFGPFQQR